MPEQEWQRDIDQAVELIAEAVRVQTGEVLCSHTQAYIERTLARLVKTVVVETTLECKLKEGK